VIENQKKPVTIEQRRGAFAETQLDLHLYAKVFSQMSLPLKS